MKNQIILNPTRLGQLLSNDVRIYGKRILIAIFSVMTLLFPMAFFMFTDFSQRDGMIDIHGWLYPFTLIGLGLLLTGYMFREMGQVHERQHYLSLPASNLEKYSARWLMIIIVYPIVFTLIYFIISLLFEGIIKSLGYTVEMWDFEPFSWGTYVFFRVFLSVQSVFMLGAIHFRNYTTIKTIVYLNIAAVFAAIFTVLMFRLVMAPYFDGWSFNDSTLNIQPSQSFQNLFWNELVDIAQGAFFYILPLYLWIVSYLKFTEQEV